MISVYVGGKHDEGEHRRFAPGLRLSGHKRHPEYFQVLLTARYGPLATSDYRILLEASHWTADGRSST